MLSNRLLTPSRARRRSSAIAMAGAVLVAAVPLSAQKELPPEVSVVAPEDSTQEASSLSPEVAERAGTSFATLGSHAPNITLESTEAVELSSWSDWTGPDADNDGFVDVPYVFDGGQDDLPFAGRDAPPLAVAGGDQSIHAGETVFLDGTGSYDDNTASPNLWFDWVFTASPAGSAAVLTGSNTATPSFFADLPGDDVIQLTVTDEQGRVSEPDSTMVSSLNLAPTAVAGGEESGVVCGWVALDASASPDPEDDALTYSWALIGGPDGLIASLADAGTSYASFIPDLSGQYVVELTVNDGYVDSLPSQWTIIVISGEDHAQNLAVAALDFVASLGSASVTTHGNQTAMSQFLRQVVEAMQEGDLAKAKDKLGKAIGRTDGCPLRGGPDGNGPGRDWITDCDAQNELYALLEEALRVLTECE